MRSFRAWYGRARRSAALAALAGLVPSGCAEPSASAPPPVLVGTVESERMDFPVVDMPNGTVVALESVTIRARVRGFIIEKHFEDGSFVKKGDLLFVIDEEPYKVALDSARAKKAQAEAAVRKAEQSRGREVATAKLALDAAQLEFKRIVEHRARALLTRHAGSQEELDRAEADRRQFEAQAGADRASSDQAQADYETSVLSARAQLEAAKAGVRDAWLNLSYCRITSPIDGRIGASRLDVGNLAGPGQENGTSTDLATIQQLDPIGVEIQMNSRYLARATQFVQRRTPVTLNRPGVEGEEEHPYPGRLDFIDNTIDETTSTFRSRARMPNPKSTLLPGEYVKLRMEIERLKGVVVVPARAVKETETGPVVYVVDKEGKAAIQRVKSDPTTYQGRRVLLEGLDAGAPVVVDGIELIRPGVRVSAQPATIARPADTPTTAVAQ